MHPRLERLQKDFRDFKRLFTEEGVIDPSRRKALEKIAASPVVIPLAAISEIKKETTPEGDSYDKIKGYRVHEATKDAFGYVDVQMADGFVYSDDLYYLCLRIGEEGGVLDKNTGRVLVTRNGISFTAAGIP